jgi:murein DD-endopeptidase MepM/ murein hydrolase activator NlpD
MSKILFGVITVLSLVLSIFNTTPISQAAKSVSVDTNLSSQSKATEEQSTISSSSLIQNANKKSKPIIVDGELDVEPDVQMTKEQKQIFNKCKNDEKSRRSKRNKNKPTSCIKIPTKVHEELTDQDYSTLIDQIQEQKDVTDKKDMNLELSISDFLKTKNVEACISNSISVQSSSFVTKSSSSSDNCTSQNSSISSISSSLSNTSAISSNSTFSSQFSSSLPSNSSLITSQKSIVSLSSVDSIVQSSISQNSSTKSSFLDLIFGGIKAEAAGVEAQGYRIPYNSGTRVKTLRTFNGSATHASHNAIDFFSINKDTGVKNNQEIVAAKGGTIFLSNASTGLYDGLGDNYIIQQDDGHYAVYAHLSAKYLNKGDKVTRGQKIGVQGTTGTIY